MRPLRRLSAVAPLALALALSACEALEPPDLRERQLQELEWNRARWESAEIHDYRFWLTVECACPGGTARVVEITVIGGVPQSVVYYAAVPGEDPPPADFFSRFDTVEELFDLIDEALTEDAGVAVLYETRYALGHPEAIAIDYDEFRTDDELTVVMPLELEILE